MTSWIKDFVLLTLIVGALFGATLGRYPLSAPDGGRYAEIPREMVVTGDYITPHLNGVKYFEKPPLFYWLQAVSIKTLGANEVAASIANAIMALGCVLGVYFTGRKLYGRLSGMLAAFIFATSSLVFALTRVLTIDVTLTFFLSGSLCSFILATQLPLGTKRSLYLWLMYALAACAVMTKGLIGIVLLGIILICWITIFNEWRNLKNYRLLSGGFIFLLIALPWHILVQIKNPEFLRFYFLEQHFLRYFTDYASRSQKWWFLPVVSLVGLYPWMTFLPQTIVHNIPKHFKELKQSKPTIFLLLWIACIYTFFSFSNSKLIPYILPIFPPIAMLIGNYFAANWQNNKSRQMDLGFYALFTLNIILAIAAISASFILDFNEQAFTKQNLYFIAGIMVVGTLVTAIAYRRHNTSSGFFVMVLAAATLWLYFSPNITTINRQSIKPLITTMQQRLQPEDEVIVYRDYYQELPFYLKRIVTVAQYSGELAFGIAHQDTSSWMIDEKTFWERWHSDRVVYLITGESNYRNLLPSAPDKMRIIAKLWDTLLVVNSK
ncbi:MAG: glycosyltransferase family 39 protein [Gammaproteobacteria bacterium]|nr:glycosyltransferase family 39 protein [Gammaproteobacteria bacterium]